VPKLDPQVKNRIAGIVVFGDTYHVKDKGTIPGYAKDRFLAFCNTSDLVCHDASASFPVILPAHLTYSSDAPAAIKFFQQKISAAQ